MTQSARPATPLAPEQEQRAVNAVMALDRATKGNADVFEPESTVLSLRTAHRNAAVLEISRVISVTPERADNILRDFERDCGRGPILCQRNIEAETRPLRPKWVRGDGRSKIEIIDMLTALEGVSYESSWKEVMTFCGCLQQKAEEILHYFNEQDILRLEPTGKWVRVENVS